MKKVLSFVLALCMVMSAGAVFAEDEYEAQKENKDIVPASRLIELVTRISKDNGGNTYFKR